MSRGWLAALAAAALRCQKGGRKGGRRLTQPAACCLLPRPQVWQQQQSRRWHDNPLIARDCELLSTECVDLLNAMFEIDEKKR